ncbi:MAG: 4-hydroxythreonine-4-phosphate dehydrogenase PdxA [Desulfobulbaceae bacterium]|nr:4-hydroxythreonine-4-phosphate dehydrogenase PdxA [Desulfobulbaceae bacterium]
MGCPAGIGPEIILKYFSSLGSDHSSDVRPVILGDPTVLEMSAKNLALAQPNLQLWQPGSPLPEQGIPIVKLSSLSQQDIVWGSPNLSTAKAMAAYIEHGVKLINEKLIDGITTCPISKASLNSAGYNFPGHTEMLGSLTCSDGYVMMMAGTKLRITLVTIHYALKDVPEKITEAGVLELIHTTHQSLTTDFGIKNPKIAVAALNPHAGEDKLFGVEESNTIVPAINRARKQNIYASGPYPPDTVFNKAVAGDFDAVVCMYHDQGLIPFKLLHFEDGVNVTLGLPIVRTSVDHGTAYDIAGKGVASYLSLQEAVKLAGTICNNRNSVTNQ